MPLKLLCGASRKITDGNYGSRGADLHFEVELDPMLLGDVPQVQERIRQLYDVIRQALAEELAHGETLPAPAPGDMPDRPTGDAQSNGAAGAKPHGAPNRMARRATPAQIKAISRIVEKQERDLSAVLRGRYCVERIEDLSLRDASALIDALRRGDTRSGE